MVMASRKWDGRGYRPGQTGAQVCRVSVRLLSASTNCWLLTVRIYEDNGALGLFLFKAVIRFVAQHQPAKKNLWAGGRCPQPKGYDTHAAVRSVIQQRDLTVLAPDGAPRRPTSD